MKGSGPFCQMITMRRRVTRPSREILARVALEQGEEGLQRYAFDVTLKLAELTGRVAAVHRLAAVDLADILFLD